MSIDSYMDRADATLRYQPALPRTPIYEDPLYWGGQVWPSEIDKQCAIAKYRLKFRLDVVVEMSRAENKNGIPAGADCSRFQDDGKMKPQFRSPL
jgi:hypothetical protein